MKAYVKIGSVLIVLASVMLTLILLCQPFGSSAADISSKIADATVSDFVINEKPAKLIEFKALEKDIDISAEAAKNGKKPEDLLNVKVTEYYGSGNVRIVELKNVTRNMEYVEKTECTSETVETAVFSNATKNEEIVNITTETCHDIMATKDVTTEEEMAIDPKSFVLTKDSKLLEIFDGCTQFEQLPSGGWGCSLWTDLTIAGEIIEGATWWNVSCLERWKINSTAATADMVFYVNDTGNVAGDPELTRNASEMYVYNCTTYFPVANTTDELNWINSTGNSGNNPTGVFRAEVSAFYGLDGHANDLTSNNNDMTNTGAVYVAGIFGKAADFEKTDGDYMNKNDAASLDITQQLTMSLWVKFETLANTLGTDENFIGKWSDARGIAYIIHMSAAAGSPVRCHVAGATTAYRQFNFTFAAGTWYHVACVYSTDDDSLHVYVNGTLKDGALSGTVPNVLSDVASPFWLGCSENAASNPAFFYDGLIDDARVYNDSLAAAEILDIYKNGVGMLSSLGAVENYAAPVSPPAVPTVSWITTGGFTSSSLSYGQVISEINATIGNNATVVNVTFIDPDGIAALSQQAMTNSSMTAWNYTGSITLNKAGNWTLYVNASNADGYNSSTSTITVTTSSLTLISKWYGFSGQKILNSSEISDNAAYDFFIYEMEDNMSALSSNWAAMLSAINNSYNQNIRVGLNYLLDCNINLTSCTNGFKLNVTANMSKLQNAPYSATVEYISLEIVNPDNYNSTQKDSVLNDIAKNVTSAISNKFPVYSKGYNSSGFDSAYLTIIPMLYVSDATEAAWINTEAYYLRNNASLNRIYEGIPAALKDDVKTYYNNILKVMRSMPLTSSSIINMTIAELENGDMVFFNNGSVETVMDYDVSACAACSGKDVWDYTNKYLIDDDTAGMVEVNVSAYSATMAFIDDIDHIEMTSASEASVYKGGSSSGKVADYSDGARDGNWGLYGANDIMTELYDPHYNTTNFITYYGWLNASAISYHDMCAANAIIIYADKHNDGETDMLIGNCTASEVYGYISVADYVDSDEWNTNKSNEVDAYLALNVSLHMFIDGLDTGIGGTNFNTRMRTLVDYTQITKSRKVILNTYTAYQNFATWGKGGVMKESCVNRWNGTDASAPTAYDRESWELELNKSLWYNSHNIRVLCQAFNNRTTDGSNIIYNYTELQDIYFASKILGYDYFYLSQPDFNYAYLEYVYNVGNDLSNGYETDDSETYYRRYENGIVYYNSSTGHGWIDDGRIVNYATVCFNLYDAHANGVTFDFSADGNATAAASISDGWGVGVWSIQCANLTSPPTNGRYLIRGWVSPRTTTAGQGLSISYATVADGSKRSWWDTNVLGSESWTAYGYGQNWESNISVSETKKASIDTTGNIMQTNTTEGNMNVTISSSKGFNVTVWTSPVRVSTFIRLEYWNGTDAITLNYTNTSTCNTTDPTWNTSVIAGETHKACIMPRSEGGYWVRVSAPSLSSRTYTIVSDITPPVITIAIPSNSTTASAAFSFSFDEEIATAKYSLDGASNVTNSTLSASWTGVFTLSEGTHYVKAWANDTAGNAATAVRYWTYDITQPAIANHGVYDCVSANQTATIEWIQSDTYGISASWCNITHPNGETWAVNASSLASGDVHCIFGNTTRVANGYSALITVSDNAGNSRNATVTFDVLTVCGGGNGGGGFLYIPPMNITIGNMTVVIVPGDDEQPGPLSFIFIIMAIIGSLAWLAKVSRKRKLAPLHFITAAIVIAISILFTFNFILHEPITVDAFWRHIQEMKQAVS